MTHLPVIAGEPEATPWVPRDGWWTCELDFGRWTAHIDVTADRGAMAPEWIPNRPPGVEDFMPAIHDHEETCPDCSPETAETVIRLIERLADRDLAGERSYGLPIVGEVDEAAVTGVWQR